MTLNRGSTVGTSIPPVSPDPNRVIDEVLPTSKESHHDIGIRLSHSHDPVAQWQSTIGHSIADPHRVGEWTLPLYQALSEVRILPGSFDTISHNPVAQPG